MTYLGHSDLTGSHQHDTAVTVKIVRRQHNCIKTPPRDTAVTVTCPEQIACDTAMALTQPSPNPHDTLVDEGGHARHRNDNHIFDMLPHNTLCARCVVCVCVCVCVSVCVLVPRNRRHVSPMAKFSHRHPCINGICTGSTSSALATAVMTQTPL